VLSFAAEGEWFLYPRDKESLIMTGVENPFNKMKHINRMKNLCLDNININHYCSFLLNTKIPFEVEKINLEKILKKETSLFVIGERHLDAFPKILLKSWLGDLQSRYDYTHLALEMFNSSSQKDIDSYLNNEITDLELERILRSQWNYKSTYYMQLIKRAKDLGLGILAIDKRSIGKGKTLSEALRLRDLEWVKTLKKHFILNKNMKVVLLSGKLHAFEKFSTKNKEIKTVIEQLQESINIKGQSIIIYSGRSRSYHKTLFDEFFPNEKNLMYKGEEINPYTSRILLSRE
jgi:hypothetical protein